MSNGERDVFLTGIQGHWYSSIVLPGIENHEDESAAWSITQAR